MQSGESFGIASDTLNNKEQLKIKIAKLKEKIAVLEIEIADRDNYFEALKTQLEAECDYLVQELERLADSESEEISYLKEIGDKYEQFIGKEFEEKGDLVIYNGLIKGYEDQGVDIISIAIYSKTIHLIQCKNWTKMRMTLEHLQDIYRELDEYNFDCFDIPVEMINKYQTVYYNKDIHLTLVNTKNNLSDFTIIKTLYLASDKVVELEIGQYLTMMSPTLFQYQDMKIVMKVGGF